LCRCPFSSFGPLLAPHFSSFLPPAIFVLPLRWFYSEVIRCGYFCHLSPSLSSFSQNFPCLFSFCWVFGSNGYTQHPFFFPCPLRSLSFRPSDRPPSRSFPDIFVPSFQYFSPRVDWFPVYPGPFAPNLLLPAFFLCSPPLVQRIVYFRLSGSAPVLSDVPLGVPHLLHYSLFLPPPPLSLRLVDGVARFHPPFTGALKTSSISSLPWRPPIGLYFLPQRPFVGNFLLFSELFSGATRTLSSPSPHPGPPSVVVS